MPANNILGFYCLNDEGILSESGAKTKLWDICFIIARVDANDLNVMRFESCPVNYCHVKCHDIRQATFTIQCWCASECTLCFTLDGETGYK